MTPRRIAASVGRQTGRADDPGHDPLGRAQRRLDQRGWPAGGLDPGPGERLLQRGVTGRVADRGEACAQAAGLLGKARRVAVGGQRLDRERIGIAQQQIDGALPDRAGRTEDRHASHRFTPRFVASAGFVA